MYQKTRISDHFWLTFESSRFSIVSRFSFLVVFRNFDFWVPKFFKRLNSSGGWSGFRTKDSVFIHIVPGTSSAVSKFLIIFVINTTKIVCFIWKRKKSILHNGRTREFGILFNLNVEHFWNSSMALSMRVYDSRCT